MKIRPYLITRSLIPENQEAPNALFEDRYFFLRNHFPYSSTVPHSIIVGGLVQSPISLSLDQLKRMPSTTLIVPLECAGNQRSKFNPPAFGEQWESGAISQGKWTGVPLKRYIGISENRQDPREGKGSDIYRGRCWNTE